jgi:hypothetical protein
VAVELIKDEGPFYSKGPIDPSDPSGLSSGSSYVMVGGLPAIYAESGGTSSDPTLTLDWTLSVPDNIFARHTIEAKIHGPGLDELKAQVESMVASLRFDPPVSSPNAGDVTKIVASGLDQAAVKDPGYACFPRKQATGATARVAALPGTRLSQPLEVTCSAGIQPFESWLWKVTLTVSWAPASDHTGGSYVTILWLAADGTLRGTYSPQGQSAIPYAQ